MSHVGAMSLSVSLSAGAEGGYCNQPGECQCREGFSGENCGELSFTLPSPPV